MSTATLKPPPGAENSDDFRGNNRPQRRDVPRERVVNQSSDTRTRLVDTGLRQNDYTTHAGEQAYLAEQDRLAAQRQQAESRRREANRAVSEQARQNVERKTAAKTTEDLAEAAYWNKEVEWNAPVVKAANGKQLCNVMAKDERLRPLLMNAAALWKFVKTHQKDLARSAYEEANASKVTIEGPETSTSRQRASNWFKSQRIVVDNQYIREWDEVADLALRACGSPASRADVHAFLQRKVGEWKGAYLQSAA